MTDITFHFNVSDRLAYSCRLLRKAHQKSASVVVTGDRDVLEQLDRLLWSISAVDFVPHCSSTALARTVAASAVVLADSLVGVDRDGVLINLGQALPSEFERFERFIEVVTLDESDRLAARQRWKHYASRGYALSKHDAATAVEAV
ncbi:MAG: DNA polymerase III subunit chi [Polaromonas sp.]|nr:DNA polymerase III subunit chi [Polaromonas sp.]